MKMAYVAELGSPKAFARRNRVYIADTVLSLTQNPERRGTAILQNI